LQEKQACNIQDNYVTISNFEKKTIIKFSCIVLEIFHALNIHWKDYWDKNTNWDQHRWCAQQKFNICQLQV